MLKDVFHRSRPGLGNPILTFSSYGFPSGHTIAATFLWRCGDLRLWKIRTWPGRVLAVMLSTFLVLLVGFSRIYLGARYLSDVLGAMMEGLARLALCLTAVNTTWRVRHRDKPPAGVS